MSGLFRSCLRILLGLVFLALVKPALAADAEVVSVSGQGERRDGAQFDWIAAAPRHLIKPGGFARTRDMSQMALLLPDRTQIRLNQNSQIQIKTVADAAAWSQSTVALNSGRAWSQARPPSPAAGTSAPATRLTVETPSATLSIRGTDWEVEVAPDGRTQLVVLSGEVDIANPQGALKVSAGEAALAEIGKAPVRLLIANPAERVQWVTAWQPQPRRWTPDAARRLPATVAAIERGELAQATAMLATAADSAERDILRADIAMVEGRADLAQQLLAAHAGAGRGDPGAAALLARVHLALGDGAAAGRLLAAARQAHAGSAEIWLASADAALFAGAAESARADLQRALALAPGHADGHFALGSLETERENFRAAGAALQAALELRPGFARALAEQATLATLSGELASAAAAFARALELRPDDYLALCGRGLLALKSGRPADALADFLRAGVIEPRFARAWLYSAAAFYQLGEPARARDALDKAARLDPRDPLPHVLRAMMAADALQLGAAVDAAAAAQQRMPYLKSLNQVLNNQKGHANVGSSLAAFGLEEWARHYAAEAYSPWWAGSHLFLADRLAPGFNKNSELFKGFLTDPTVFGASQRHSTLTPAPGHHGRADLFLEQADWRQDALIATANGLVVEPWPAAYFLSGDGSRGQSRLSADRADGGNLTLGLGLRPRHDLGVFLFGTDTGIRGMLNSYELPGASLVIDQGRLDLGFNLKLDSRNQLWLKGGNGSQTAGVVGRIRVDRVGIVPLDGYASRIEQDDIQLRHVYAAAENGWWSWGLETSTQGKQASFAARVTPALALDIREDGRLRRRDVHLVARQEIRDGMLAELGVLRQFTNYRQDARRTRNGTMEPGYPTQRTLDLAETNWRGGLRLAMVGNGTLTLAAQRWRRPAGVASLAPQDTLGIALNDELTSAGGLYQRTRLQFGGEAGGAYFMAYADREQVRNLESPSNAVVPDMPLTELEALRNRRDAFTARRELEETPRFLEGRVRSAGLAVNLRLSGDHTAGLRYRRAEARQTGQREGLAIPYMARDYVDLSSHWALPERLLLGAHATWRGARFHDEANAKPIAAGWILGFSGYWESSDKRWVLQAILDNLRANKDASAERNSRLIARASYLF